MATIEIDRLAQARRAYEWGRWVATRRDSWVVALAVAWAALRHGEAPLVAAVGLALLALASWLSWRGGTQRRGLWLGYFAGAVPLILPSLVTRGMTSDVFGHCVSTCALLCPLAGVLAGALLGGSVAKRTADRATLFASAGSVTLLIGLLGCASAGGWGVVGLAVGGLLGSASAFALGRRAAA